MIRVFIADDHAVVRQGLKQIFSDSHDITVAGEGSNANEIMEGIRKKNYDVLLLDISLPGMNGLEIIKQIQHEQLRQPVLVLTVYPEEQYAMRAIRAGACGYLNKGCEPSELIKAIRSIAKGRKYFTYIVLERLVYQVGLNTKKTPHERLSDREYQVMCLIARGKRIGDIAKELALSGKTISTYRARILEKLNVKSTAEIIHYAITQELIEWTT
ncbi:MAG: response regulator transcription factor [Syntrophaceae bacterium]|nr:response regulator transcription factor [Syntrophaceae bacterium]